MDKDNKNNKNEFEFECKPVNDMEKFNDEKSPHKRGDKLINTATDVYYKTQCKLPDSEVAIPTFDSVVEAKEWVDDVNKM